MTRHENAPPAEAIRRLLHDQPYAVLCTQGQRRLGPWGQRLVVIVIRSVCAAVEPHFAPRDPLIQEGLSRLAHPPPSFARASGFLGQISWRPSFMSGKAVEHLVGGDMAKMKIRRQATGDFDLRLVTKFRVRRQFPIQEPLPAGMGGCRTAHDLHGGHAVVDRQCRQSLCFTRQQAR